MRKIRQFFAMITAISMIATLFVAMPTVSAEADYAMIEFNESGIPTLTNITRWVAGGSPVGTANYKPVKVGGKWGGSTDRKNAWGNGSIYSLCLDVEDSFLYDLDNGDKLKLTVEFWDGAHPTLNQPTMPEEGKEYARLRFLYPGYDYQGKNVSQATSSDIHVRQRDEWTRASLIIDNARCDNSLWGAWDFDFTDWGGSVNIQRDVIIKSVKIEKVEDEKPIRLTDRINLGTTGNIENIEKEKLTLYVPMENTEETDADIDWTFEIYDENERLVDEFSYSTTVAAGAKKTDTVAFDTPELCGVYTIKAFSRAGYTNPETGRHETNFVSYDRENFSVSYINKVNEGNDNLGINVHTIGGGQGETEKIADAVVAAGYGWIREANQPSASVNKTTGEWTLSQAVVDDLAYYKNKGISIMNQIWGPIWQWEDSSHGGCIPQNDEERAIFRKYMEEYVEKTAPYVDAYEVFNETESSMFPSGYTGTVEDRAAVYLESLKIVDEVVGDTAPVVAAATADQQRAAVDFNKALWSLGAYEYIDIFSTHRYPYTGTEYIRYLLVDQGAEGERNRVKEYTGGTVPFDEMWLTEIGYASPDLYADGAYTGQSGEKGYTWWNKYWDWHGFEDGIPRREQARGISNAYLVNTVTDEAFDKLFAFNIVDHYDLTYFQYTWGMLNCYEEVGGYTPYSAKPAFVATAAFNHFIDDTSVVGALLKGNVTNEYDYWHAAWFDNSKNTKFDEDVIVLQADVASSKAQGSDKYINLTTGAPQVDVYDLYGSYLGTMKNSDGKYWMPVTHEPYYLVGKFDTLDGSVSNYFSKSPITLTNRYNKNDVLPGSTATFTVRGMSSGDTIEVRGLDVESIEGGTVNVKVPNLYSGKAFGQVLVKDSAGNLKYANVVEFWLTAPELRVKTYDENVEIKGFTGLGNGGVQVSALITDDEGDYLAVDQKRALESGIFEFDLRLPQNRSKICNLKLYNGTVTLNQQLVMGTEFYYTCYKNGEKISFANLNLEDLAENDEIKFVLNLNNANGETPNVTLIGGVYDKDGLLVNADVTTIGEDEWDGDSKQLRVSLTIEDVENIGGLKFFTWDNKIKPIKDANIVD